MTKRKRGFTMTYAVVLLLIVSVLVSLLLLTAALTSKSSVTYCNYVDSKNFLDKVGADAVFEFAGKTKEAVESKLNVTETQQWNDKYAGHKFGYQVQVVLKVDDTLEVSVVKNNKKALIVQFELTGDAYQLKTYLYDVPTADAEVNP